MYLQVLGLQNIFCYIHLFHVYIEQLLVMLYPHQRNLKIGLLPGDK